MYLNKQSEVSTEYKYILSVLTHNKQTQLIN